ncbi:MAG: hypothetical protein HQL01_13810 [Nitrospirae bacterium]|nr:hypothetical protein [Nitrospirota bacterium]
MNDNDEDNAIVNTQALPKWYLKEQLIKDITENHILINLTPCENDTTVQDSTELPPKNTIPAKLIRKGFHENKARTVSLQKWEGYVLEIFEDTFIARLIDLTNESPDEEAEFYIDDLSGEDKELLQLGAVFYWNIGYHIASGGQRTRGSTIRFRRLPAWRKEDIKSATQKAERLLEYFENEKSKFTTG